MGLIMSHQQYEPAYWNTCLHNWEDLSAWISPQVPLKGKVPLWDLGQYVEVCVRVFCGLCICGEATVGGYTVLTHDNACKPDSATTVPLWFCKHIKSNKPLLLPCSNKDDCALDHRTMQWWKQYNFHGERWPGYAPLPCRQWWIWFI